MEGTMIVGSEQLTPVAMSWLTSHHTDSVVTTTVCGKQYFEFKAEDLIPLIEFASSAGIRFWIDIGEELKYEFGITLLTGDEDDSDLIALAELSGAEIHVHDDSINVVFFDPFSAGCYLEGVLDLRANLGMHDLEICIWAEALNDSSWAYVKPEPIWL